jgi:DNA-directed RNA polymerase subunit K/omega
MSDEEDTVILQEEERAEDEEDEEASNEEDDDDVEEVDDELASSQDDSEEEDDDIVDSDENADEDETIDEGEEVAEALDPDQRAKFDDVSRNEYLQTVHNDEIHLSFEEICALATVQRTSEGRVIPDANHQTFPILSKYERTKVIGLRVAQLNKGAQPLVALNHKILDNSLIAEKELKEGKLPNIIRRRLPNGKFEYWYVKDLECLI